MGERLGWRVHLFIFFACLQVASQKNDSLREVPSAGPLANTDNKKEKTKDKKERKEKKEGEKTKKEKKEKRKLEGESLQVSSRQAYRGLLLPCMLCTQAELGKKCFEDSLWDVIKNCFSTLSDDSDN